MMVLKIIFLFLQMGQFTLATDNLNNENNYEYEYYEWIKTNKFTQENYKIDQNNRDNSNNNKRTPTKKSQQNLETLTPDEDENKVKKDKLLSRLFSCIFCQKKKQFTKYQTNSIESINIRANVKIKVKSFSSSITPFYHDLQSRKYSSDEKNEDKTYTRTAIDLVKTPPPRFHLQARVNKDDKKHTANEDKQQFSEKNIEILQQQINNKTFNKIKIHGTTKSQAWAMAQQKYHTTAEFVSDVQLSFDTQIKVLVNNDQKYTSKNVEEDDLERKNTSDEEVYEKKYTNKFSSEFKDGKLFSKPEDILHYLCLEENPNYCEKCKEFKQIFEKKSFQSQPPFLHKVPMDHFAQEFVSEEPSTISIVQVILEDPQNKKIYDFMNENIRTCKFVYEARCKIENFIMQKAQTMYPFGGHIFFSIFKTKFLEKDLTFFFENNIISSNESHISIHEENDGMTFINNEWYHNIFLFDELVNELRLEKEE